MIVVVLVGAISASRAMYATLFDCGHRKILRSVM